MELFFTLSGIICLASLIAIYILFGAKLPFEGLSLPCITVLTSGVYFYLMPFLALIAGGRLNEGFFGMYITSLAWPHFAVFLYTIGATAAFLAYYPLFSLNPARLQAMENVPNWKMYFLLCILAVAGLIAQTAMGKLNLTGSATYAYATTTGNLQFINLFFTMMVSLTLIYLIRDNFKIRSLIILLLVMLVFIQIGFRFRMVLLLAGAFSSYMLVKGWKVRMIYVALGSTAGLFLSNIVGNARRYGKGMDLSVLQGQSAGDIFKSVGGEVGAIYVITDITSNPLPPLVYFDPWLVGVARLVPSFLWPDKPKAEYLQYFLKGFSVDGAAQAGIAAPQQVEMLLQFGWIGLPFIAFLYFSIAAFLVSRFHTMSREARIAGFALVPVFFGFYMQTRGYFFQILSDGLFLFAPLFLMHIGVRKIRRTTSAHRQQKRWRHI